MDILYFLDTTFDTSRINSTVRKGSKWFRGELIDTIIPIRRTGSDVDAASAKIVAMRHMRWADITEDVIAYQHSVETQSMSGITKAMNDAYGSMDADDMVTIVYFEIVGER